MIQTLIISLFQIQEEYHCGSEPKLYLAKPEDLIIVCGESNTEVQGYFF